MNASAERLARLRRNLRKATLTLLVLVPVIGVIGALWGGVDPVDHARQLWRSVRDPQETLTTVRRRLRWAELVDQSQVMQSVLRSHPRLRDISVVNDSYSRGVSLTCFRKLSAAERAELEAIFHQYLPSETFAVMEFDLEGHHSRPVTLGR